MNNIQRRLFRVFAEAGGDLSEDAEVERFIRYVEGNLLLLPPKVREAIELIWRSREDCAYATLTVQLAYREQRQVSIATLRQRVSRGARLLEDAVRRRSWSVMPGASDGGAVFRRTVQGSGNGRART